MPSIHKNEWKMLGTCVTNKGSNDDVSNFPEVNIDFYYYFLDLSQNFLYPFPKKVSNYNILTLSLFCSLDMNDDSDKKLKYSLIINHFFLISRFTLNGQIIIWSVAKQSDVSLTCRQTAAMDCFWLKSSRRLPTSKFPTWRENLKHNNKWWANEEISF